MFPPPTTFQLLARLRLLALVPAFALAGCATDGPEFVRANTNPKPTPLVAWPKPNGEVAMDQTKRVYDHFDGKMQRFYGVDDLGTSGQEEDQFPMFRLSDGAVIENVIIGDPAADGIHCYGSCTIKNVWWERVGEDAATFRGAKDSDVMLIDGGGASGAKDKVFQNNLLGTMIIKNFYFEHFGKLYRSCGNCSRQAGRTVILENITAVVSKKSSCLVGINENYGDIAIFKGINQIYAAEKPKVPACQKFIGNAKGLEPKKSGVGADGKYCFYDDSSLVWNL
jgi:hypothetical protein